MTEEGQAFVRMILDAQYERFGFENEDWNTILDHLYSVFFDLSGLNNPPVEHWEDVDPPPPDLGTYRVTATPSLNVRTGPGTTHPLAGTLAPGHQVKPIVIREISSRETWLQIGPDRWVAYLYNGAKYLQQL